MGGRLLALLLLGFALLKTLFLRMVRRGSLGRFNLHYGSEGILSVSREEARVLSQAGRCTACGFCDAAEGDRVVQSQRGSAGVMQFICSGTRSLPDYAAAAHTLDGISTEQLTRAQMLCPEGVPIVALANLVRSYAARQASTAQTD